MNGDDHAMNTRRYAAVLLFASYKGPELRSYSQMLKGLMAYQEKHQLV